MLDIKLCLWPSLTQPNLGQIKLLGTVLESSGRADSKTVPGFDNQPRFVEQLKCHMQSQHEGVKFLCDICEKQYTSQDSLKRHQKEVHEDIKYSCGQCEKQYTKKLTWKDTRQSIKISNILVISVTTKLTVKTDWKIISRLIMKV